jgi:hypothetical protein
MTYDKEEIELFNRLSLAMELDEDKDYNVAGKEIAEGKGIDFCITTQYPDGLPDNIGTMFFNVDNNFDVNVVETNQCASAGERFFQINLKKL